MNTPLSWIKDYVPELSCTPQEYSDRMTLSGTKVESFEELSKNLKDIVIGRVLSVEKHPDADKLTVCQVDVGEKIVQIVTGAPNIKVGESGMLVPVVLSGGKVAGGHDGGPLPENGIMIKAGKLRGVESDGMMCSIEELGSDKNYYRDAPESGIYIFGEDIIKEYGLKPGDDAIKALGMDDVVFDYEITSNRVDCYSVIGIAREAAATFNKKFVMPNIKSSGNSEDAHDYIKVTVEDPDLCPRYIARVVKNIKFAPSPEWLQKRLRNSGIRPINNLVDITNFVMEEFGQPMHAYDYDDLSGHEIVVKCAKEGDLFTTLDGQERKLDGRTLMINDAEKPVGIAGIMGGQNSMITDQVHTVLFEAANFNGVNIRRSAQKIGMRTDASSIFEKGLDPANAELAINRACELVEELGCGEVVGGMVDVYAGAEAEKRISFEPERINALLGLEVPEDEMKAIFRKLELGFDEEKNEVIVPTFRRDLECTADLAEEVLRFYGYDKIEDTLPVGESTNGRYPFKILVDQAVREVAEFSGFSHAFTYAFESPKAFDKLMIPKDSELRKAIVISNPLGEDFSIMRTQTLNAMLTALSLNYNRRNKDVMLYDMANIYIAKELPLKDLPDEREQLTLGGYGDYVDFYVMKGVVEEVFERLGLGKKIHYEKQCDRPYLHPGRRADIVYDGKVFGFLGEVHPEVSETYGFKPGVRVYTAVLDMPMLTELASFDRIYENIIKYPANTRDISMLVPKELPVGSLEDVIEKKGGHMLDEYHLFDIYEGEQVAEGLKSVAYSLSFRAKDRTLTNEEVDEVMEKILEGLKELGAELRS